MAPRTPRPLITVTLKELLSEQEKPLHNRWHPDIPPVAEVQEGELFRVETVDCSGGQIHDNDSAEDMKNMDLSAGHYLCGPIKVLDSAGVAAKPGDLLMVEICNLGPLPRMNGGLLEVWTTKGVELLEIWNQRERQLVEEGDNAITLGAILHTRPLANLPLVKGALLGKVYLLLSCCPCEGRISGIVDSPNAVATVSIPTAIFDQDIRPKMEGIQLGPKLINRGDVCKSTYDGVLPLTKNLAEAENLIIQLEIHGNHRMLQYLVMRSEQQAHTFM